MLPAIRQISTHQDQTFSPTGRAQEVESFTELQAGFTVDKVFEVRLVEYGGQRFLDHEDERYEILRTYEKGETIELVCLRRDANHGS